MHKCCHPDPYYICPDQGEPSMECRSIIIEETSDLFYCCNCYNRMYWEAKAREKRGELIYREEARMMRIERDKRNSISRKQGQVGKKGRDNANWRGNCRERKDGRKR